jgi:2-deoxy-D-gluconate 3-dehydrogenase
MDLRLAGRVFIVTGASQGLGAACVRSIVAEGGKVLAAARSEKNLESIAAELPGAVAIAKCDMRDRVAVGGLVDVALSTFGRLDGIVNNAGIAPAGSFETQSLDVFDEVLAVNLLAPAALAQRAGLHWIALKQPGSIVNVASTSGLKGKPILVAYSSSKGAMMRFTESLAAEWARHEIRVNTIAPGAFDTAAQSAVTADARTLDSRLKKIPLRRMGAPEELGPLVCYLLSPLSSFVTGACFVIDGGEVSKL